MNKGFEISNPLDLEFQIFQIGNQNSDFKGLKGKNGK